MTGWSGESGVGGHHPREGMTPKRCQTLGAEGVEGRQGGEVTWPADGAALPGWGVALQAGELWARGPLAPHGPCLRGRH